MANFLKKAWNAFSKDDPVGHSFKETVRAVGNEQILGASPTSRAGFQEGFTHEHKHAQTCMHR